MNEGLKKGFTLIELLIVIVIIGILAGVVLSILRPDLARKRALETVQRSNVEKACLALKSCGISVGQGVAAAGNGALKCDDALNELGIDTTNINDKPDATTNYCLQANATDTVLNDTTLASASNLCNADALGTAAGTTETSALRFVSTRLSSAGVYCNIGCQYDFGTSGSPVTEINIGPGCSIVD